MQDVRISNNEFEVMNVIWSNPTPATTSLIMDKLGKKKKWKVQSVITFITRLIEKGYLISEKNGKERLYYPIVGKDSYLRYETKHFLSLYHSQSVTSLFTALCDVESLSKDDIDELIELLNQKRG